MFYGAIVTAKVTDTKHRRSPLIQGGLEVSIKVTVTMNASPEQWQSMKNLLPKEPVDGKLEDVTNDILGGKESATDEEDLAS